MRCWAGRWGRAGATVASALTVSLVPTLVVASGGEPAPTAPAPTAPAPTAPAPTSPPTEPPTTPPPVTDAATTLLTDPPSTTAVPDASTTGPPTATATAVTVPGSEPGPVDSEPVVGTTVVAPDDESATTSLVGDAEPEGLEGEVTEEDAEIESPRRLADGHVRRSITYPVLGGSSIGSGWNDQREGGGRYHHGVDVVANPGQVVVSPVDGTVVGVLRRHRTAGYGLMIRDDAGYVWALFHLARGFGAGIGVGARVEAGQLVGFVGGDQGIPHAHVELRRPSGVQINPGHSIAAASLRDLPCADASEVTDEWSNRGGIRVSPDRSTYRTWDGRWCAAPDPEIVDIDLALGHVRAV